jgi:hypothetical protein
MDGGAKRAGYYGNLAWSASGRYFGFPLAVLLPDVPVPYYRLYV